MEPETVQLAIKNLEIAQEYASCAAELIDGMLLTGSNAWGAYYAVNKNSDVDLLIVTNTLRELENVIRK